VSKQRAAVLGTGQTHHKAKRPDVSMAGLCREAIDRAMIDAQVGWDDIDAVVIGKAPDFFEGVMMPELFLADALGAVGKPLLRVHTAGSVGGATANVAASLIQGGIHKRVLAVAWEKQSESNAMWALSIPIPFNMPVNAGAGGYFAPHVRSYIRRSGAPTHIGALVAVKDRLNGAKNPYAHLHQPDITLESVQASQMLWDPIRYDETCPSSDGACAIVIGNEEAAAAVSNPAWIHATAMRSEPTTYAGRDQVNPKAGQQAAASLEPVTCAYGFDSASRRLRTATSAISASLHRPASMPIRACSPATATESGSSGASVYGSSCRAIVRGRSPADDLPKP
jgi:acetyl-CoA C-acetyltransferase